MTAQTISRASVAPHPADRRLAGFAALFRKDLTEWLRGRRAWVIAIVTSAFMTLSAANFAITSRIAAALPDEPELPVGSWDPLDNLMAAVGAQAWVLAAIFAVGSLIVAERHSGTLAWVASKPVSRVSIWLAKWASSSLMLALFAVIVPLAATLAVVVPLYGLPAPLAVVGLGLGMIALVTFFAAVGLAAGTVLPGQPAVIATGFAVFAVAPLVAALVPFDVSAVLPTAILPWFAMALTGAAVSPLTPVAFVALTAAVAALGIARTTRMEL